MDDLSFIVGLMAQNREALGFVPSTTIEGRYLSAGQYLLQQDTRGANVGYILHGPAHPGRILRITQQVIEYDRRQQGHGMDAVRTLIERANTAGCRAIVLKCAEELPSNHFWLAAGFELTATIEANNTRNRRKNVYTLDLWPLLWTRQP